jgi:glyoxylase-like metal-dependent hydrolase (beta-lactamase superfamily II)
MTQTFHFNLGKFDCFVINDGDSFYSTAEFLFSNAPGDQLKEKLAAYHLNPDQIQCANNCLVVDTGEHLVLIDTGCGSKSLPFPGFEQTGQLMPGLKELNIEPGAFDAVILTHFHYDHIGDSSDDDTGKITFPNAVHYMWKSDWEMGFKGENELTIARLNSIRDRVEFPEQDKEIFPGIKLLHAPGHTPGHMIVSVYSENEEMLCISDLIAHSIHIECPSWNMSHEYDPHQSAAVRNRYLKKALTEKLLVFAFHLEFPGLGYVIEGKDSWKWKPVA